MGNQQPLRNYPPGVSPFERDLLDIYRYLNWHCRTTPNTKIDGERSRLADDVNGITENSFYKKKYFIAATAYNELLPTLKKFSDEYFSEFVEKNTNDDEFIALLDRLKPIAQADFPVNPAVQVADAHNADAASKSLEQNTQTKKRLSLGQRFKAWKERRAEKQLARFLANSPFGPVKSMSDLEKCLDDARTRFGRKFSASKKQRLKAAYQRAHPESATVTANSAGPAVVIGRSTTSLVKVLGSPSAADAEVANVSQADEDRSEQRTPDGCRSAGTPNSDSSDLPSFAYSTLSSSGASRHTDSSLLCDDDDDHNGGDGLQALSAAAEAVAAAEAPRVTRKNLGEKIAAAADASADDASAAVYCGP